ncbi:MAG: hypothetical protein WA884_04975 [Methyloceanibacter sp.]
MSTTKLDLTSGQVTKTDRSVKWTAPDGKVYRFSTEASKATSLKNHDENIQKASSIAKDQTAPAHPPATWATSGPSKDFTKEGPRRF